MVRGLGEVRVRPGDDAGFGAVLNVSDVGTGNKLEATHQNHGYHFSALGTSGVSLVVEQEESPGYLEVEPGEREEQEQEQELGELELEEQKLDLDLRGCS